MRLKKANKSQGLYLITDGENQNPEKRRELMDYATRLEDERLIGERIGEKRGRKEGEKMVKKKG